MCPLSIVFVMNMNVYKKELFFHVKRTQSGKTYYAHKSFEAVALWPFDNIRT